MMTDLRRLFIRQARYFLLSKISPYAESSYHVNGDGAGGERA